jgi:1-acyl-sn-glycerol-3-phosphate acyltransferase
MMTLAAFRRANPVYSPGLYAVGKLVSNLLFNIGWRRKVYGRENIPPSGTPVIFAANHRSLADPNVVGSCVPYPIFYFAKAELFNVPLVGWYIRRVNSLPVKRHQQDIGAFKSALRVLENGGGLLLFPEGGRRRDPARQWKAKAGVGTLASMTGAIIVPVGVVGSDRFTKLAQVTVRFGKPIYPPKDGQRGQYQELSDRVMQQIKELCHESS